MNRKRSLRVSLSVALTTTMLHASTVWAEPSQTRGRPNLVLILTDNHSPWTLGCYGNEEIRTPHIDRLASQGMRFTQAFANNAVCSPTRATLLTGLMPSQHGVHKYINKDVMFGPKAYSTIAEFDTLPQILRESGYVCGLVGKWHLGDHMKPQEGFTHWVAKPEGHTTAFVDQKVIEDGKITVQPGHITPYWTRRGVQFIERNRDRRFFLLLAYNGPYGLGRSMYSPSASRHAAYYADKALRCFPREEPHPWLHNNRKMINNPVSMRKYAAEVSAVDDGVGEVLAALQRLDLEDDTLLVFMGDQGLAGGHCGFWGMGDHTRPLTAYDWTMRIPLIVRHPGKIRAGSTCDRMVAGYDVLPTLLGYLGLAKKMPKDPPSPGRRFDAILRGRDGNAEWDDVVFYEFENVRAIRTRRWKYVERLGEPPRELYDLESDPCERLNLADKEPHRAKQAELRKRLHGFFDRHAVAKWDLWRGGDAKGGLMLGKRPYRSVKDDAR